MIHAERGNYLKRVLDKWIGCPLVLVLGALRRPRKAPSEVRQIGLLMFGAIGDALLCSAIIEDLRRAFPAARVVAFVSLANYSTLDLVVGPDVIVRTPVSSPHRAIAMVRRHELDVLIDAGQWVRISAVIAALSNARFTIGFKTPGQGRHWAFDAVVDHSAHRHEVDNFRALLKGIGVISDSLPRFKKELLESPNRRSARPYVVFHPWASGYRCHLREWPASNWASLANLLAARGYEIIVTGGPEDAPRAEALAAMAGNPSNLSVLAGSASLKETAIILLHAAAVITVNTGVMHISALLNRPTLALHGPTNPRRWGPLGSSSVVIGPGPECGCGYLNLGFEYPPSPPDCMGRISVQEVADRLAALLQWRNPDPALGCTGKRE